MDAIQSLTEQLVAAPALGRNPMLHRLYMDLAAFTAAYFEHLEVEERQVMPALNAAMTREELIQLTDELRGSVPPIEMGRFMQSMLPSMNLLERADMLGGMSHAPAEVWNIFRTAAVRALPPAEYEAVVRYAGI